MLASRPRRTAPQQLNKEKRRPTEVYILNTYEPSHSGTRLVKNSRQRARLCIVEY